MWPEASLGLSIDVETVYGIYTSSSNSNDNTSLLSIQTTSIESTIIPSSPIPTQNQN
ncbi:2654_t:CDS:2 [Entrophospora sp. SA101]|nr:2654_t:CDS:2 [Entrophospora sp. SA101]